MQYLRKKKSAPKTRIRGSATDSTKVIVKLERTKGKAYSLLKNQSFMLRFFLRNQAVPDFWLSHDELVLRSR